MLILTNIYYLSFTIHLVKNEKNISHNHFLQFIYIIFYNIFIYSIKIPFNYYLLVTV